jgi:hypothetical protein
MKNSTIKSKPLLLKDLPKNLSTDFVVNLLVNFSVLKWATGGGGGGFPIVG